MSTSNAGPDRTVPLVILGLAGSFSLMGLVFLGVGVHKGRKAEASLSWPSVEATVTRSGRYDQREPGETTPHRAASSAAFYTVDGHRHEFTTSGLLAGDYTANGGAAPPDTRVRLYYDPADPSDFLREADRGQHSRTFEIVGALCVLATLPFWLLAIRMFRKAGVPQPAT